MPTESDLERLARIAQGKADEAPDSEAPRDSKLHLSLHVGPSGGEPPAHEKKKHWAHHAAESPWVKGIVALLLGAGGGEGHRLLSPTAMVQKSELEDHKREMAREFGREDGKIDEARHSAEAQAARCEAQRAQDLKAAYAVTRYVYYVLPKMGVLVTLPEGVAPPVPPLEFHPPPLLGTVTPNGAKPIQPAETFPLPMRPE
jgi:hypothetical protein